MPAVYIHDGYTERATIKEVPGLHGAVKFQFRPMTPEERMEWAVDNEKLKDPIDVIRNTAKVVADKLVSWDVVDENDKPLAITAGHVLGLQVTLSNRLQDVVLGQAAHDGPWPEDEKKLVLEAKLAAAKGDSSFGGAASEAKEKN